MNPGSWKRLLPWPKSERPAERNLLLRGRLVVLREKRIEDVEADYEWRVDTELASLDATTPLRLSLKEYERYFRDELEYPSPWSVRLAVDTLDGEHIGNVMYYDVDERKRQAELGIMIPWNSSSCLSESPLVVDSTFLTTCSKSSAGIRSGCLSFFLAIGSRLSHISHYHAMPDTTQFFRRPVVYVFIMAEFACPSSVGQL